MITAGLAFGTLLLSPYFKDHVSPYLPSDKSAVYDEYAPFDLARVIRDTGVEAPIFNAWEYGSFLTYMLPNKIFIDSRNTIYPEESFKTYLEVQSARPGWEQTLDHYGVRFVILNRKHDVELVRALGESKTWKKLAQNASTVLYSNCPLCLRFPR
jgi:hypothetical protein